MKKIMILLFAISLLGACATREDGRSPDPAQSNDSEADGTPSNGLAPDNVETQGDSTMQSSDSTAQQQPQ